MQLAWLPRRQPMSTMLQPGLCLKHGTPPLNTCLPNSSNSIKFTILPGSNNVQESTYSGNTVCSGIPADSVWSDGPNPSPNVAANSGTCYQSGNGFFFGGCDGFNRYDVSLAGKHSGAGKKSVASLRQ